MAEGQRLTREEAVRTGRGEINDYTDAGIKTYKMYPSFLTGTVDSVNDSLSISRQTANKFDFKDDDRTEDTLRHILLGGLTETGEEDSIFGIKNFLGTGLGSKLAASMHDYREGYGKPRTAEEEIDVNNNKFGRALRAAYPDREEFIQNAIDISNSMYAGNEIESVADLKPMLSFGNLQPDTAVNVPEDSEYTYAEGGIMMAQKGKAPLPMQEATSAPQGGGPKAANPAAMAQGLAAPTGAKPKTGPTDPRDDAIKEVSAKLQAKQAPPSSLSPALMQPPMPTEAPPINPMMQSSMEMASSQPVPEVPMMAKGGMPEDEDAKGLAVMIGLGAPSYEEAAEGNPPPGATKEEVADDQLVLLSEGELVVPANVVRYHGLGTYEGMRRDALMGLQGMEQNGQIEYVSGGKDKADKIDENGGIVKAQSGMVTLGGGVPSSTQLNANMPNPAQYQVMPTAASQQYVRTPTTSGMMRQADTTPLVLDGKPYTPTTNLTNIYAPKQDYDAGGPEDCQEGYQYNYVTQKCEKIPDPVADPVVEQTQYRAPDVGDNDNNDQNPYNLGGGSAVFGGKNYSLGYGSSSIQPGMSGPLSGIFSTLSGGVDQVVFTDRDTGRTATMSKSGYDKMKEDRNNPNTRAYIENLMDIQEGINKDYTNQKGFGAVGRKTGRPSGFLAALANPNARQFDQNNAAKALAKDMNIEYTGQSLAEMAVMSNARSSSPEEIALAARVTPESNTSAVAKQTPYRAPAPVADPLLYEGGAQRTADDGTTYNLGGKFFNPDSGARGYKATPLQLKGPLAYPENVVTDVGFDDPMADSKRPFIDQMFMDSTQENFEKHLASGKLTRTDLVRLATGQSGGGQRITNDGTPYQLSFNQEDDPMNRRLEQQAARNVLYDSSYDDLGMSTNEQMEAVGLGTNQRNLSARQVRQIEEQTSADNAALASQGKNTIVINGNTGRPVRTNSSYLTSGGGAKLDRATVIAIGDAMNKEVDKKEAAQKAAARAQETQQTTGDEGAGGGVTVSGVSDFSTTADPSITATSDKTGESVTSDYSDIPDELLNPSTDGSDGGGGGGKIVCTEMYRQTQLEDWTRTMKIWDTYQKKYLTPIHEVGYHWLFKPYVRGMKNSGILTTVGAFFAQKRTQHLKHVLTKGRAKDSLVGNLWCKIIHPIVYLVGKIVYKK